MRDPRPAPNSPALPAADRPAAEVSGHSLLARLGKRVLRPGGAALTATLLGRAEIEGADVVELAPGLGRTARDILTGARARTSASTPTRTPRQRWAASSSAPGAPSSPTPWPPGCPTPARTS